MRYSAIDHQAALSALGGDADLLSAVATIYLEDVPGLWETLRVELEASNSVAVRETLHKLKGLAGNFYAGSATDLLADLEGAAQRGELIAVGAAIDELQRRLEQVSHEVRSLTQTA